MYDVEGRSASPLAVRSCKAILLSAAKYELKACAHVLVLTSAWSDGRSFGPLALGHLFQSPALSKYVLCA